MIIFIRAYCTVDEAKQGAIARCGWQGLNKDALIEVVKQYILVKGIICIRKQSFTIQNNEGQFLLQDILKIDL